MLPIQPKARDAAALPLACEADAIFSTATFHWVLDHPLLFKSLYAALKPGGYLVITDHAALPSAPPEVGKTLHRIDEALLKKEVASAGFKLVAEGNFLRNPNDPRDKNTPDPPMPKDEFFLKFAKP